ncbi:hypothetical protein D3C71_1859410 [compost metagenome]
MEGFKQEDYPKLVLVTSVEDMTLVRELSQVIGIVLRGLDDRERDALRLLSSEQNMTLFEVGQIEEIARYVIGS